MGDFEGHPFRGNQYGTGVGGPGAHDEGAANSASFSRELARARAAGALDPEYGRGERGKHQGQDAAEARVRAAIAAHNRAFQAKHDAVVHPSRADLLKLGFTPKEAANVAAGGYKGFGGKGQPSVAELKRAGFTGGKNDAGEQDVDRRAEAATYRRRGK